MSENENELNIDKYCPKEVVDEFISICTYFCKFHLSNSHFSCWIFPCGIRFFNMFIFNVWPYLLQSSLSVAELSSQACLCCVLMTSGLQTYINPYSHSTVLFLVVFLIWLLLWIISFINYFRNLKDPSCFHEIAVLENRNCNDSRFCMEISWFWYAVDKVKMLFFLNEDWDSVFLIFQFVFRMFKISFQLSLIWKIQKILVSSVYIFILYFCLAAVSIGFTSLTQISCVTLLGLS